MGIRADTVFITFIPINALKNPEINVVLGDEKALTLRSVMIKEVDHDHRHSQGNPEE
jgi:hypothetical protein